MTLDDYSSMAAWDTWRPGSEQLKTVNAQGRKISRQGLTRAKIKNDNSEGRGIELIEEFV